MIVPSSDVTVWVAVSSVRPGDDRTRFTVTTAGEYPDAVIVTDAPAKATAGTTTAPAVTAAARRRNEGRRGISGLCIGRMWAAVDPGELRESSRAAFDAPTS